MKNWLDKKQIEELEIGEEVSIYSGSNTSPLNFRKRLTVVGRHRKRGTLFIELANSNISNVATKINTGSMMSKTGIYKIYGSGFFTQYKFTQDHD